MVFLSRSSARALEQVIQRLTVASAKYGRKDARKRDRVIYSWAHLDRTGGIHVLDACRTDIETAVKSFIVESRIFPGQADNFADPSRS